MECLNFAPSFTLKLMIMKTLYIISICSLALAALPACGNKNSDVRDSARESLGVRDQNVQTPPTGSPTFSSDVSQGGVVHHYICPDNCAGSGGPSIGNCPVCGKEYLHNQAWHTQNQGAQQTQTFDATQPDMQITPPAATNAAGVYHYICEKGCPGGSGGAGTCATCGGPLMHNAAYHQ